MKTILFLKNYIKSMRLYYCFVTLTAGYVGIALYEGDVRLTNKILLPIILFFCWGVNQIINDYLNIEEDKINAPERPMACGTLNPKAALSLSATAITGILIYAFFQNPLTMVPILAGVVANILYSKTKNIFLFAFSISCCAWLAYTMLGGGIFEFFTDNYGINFFIWVLLLLFNAIMTFFTYFKDVEGDKAAGQKTPQVIWGKEKMRKLGLLISFIPTAVFLLFIPSLLENIYAFSIIFLGAMLCIYTGFVFYKNKEQQRDYYNLKYNFAACCVLQSGLVCLTLPTEGIVLALSGFAGVILIFNLGYKNAKE